MKPTVADHIAQFLVARDVEQVFGLCGHTNISLLAAIERQGAPRFTTTRHEQIAAHAADGYARSSGRPGVVLVDGAVVGTWRPRKSGASVRVAVDLWEPAPVAAVEEQAERLAAARGARLAAVDLSGR